MKCQKGLPGVHFTAAGDNFKVHCIKVKVWVLAIALLTEARTAALYNLGSGNWLAWADDTAAHYAAIHCPLGCIKPPYSKTLQWPYGECVPFVITKLCVKYYENIMIPRGSTWTMKLAMCIILSFNANFPFICHIFLWEWKILPNHVYCYLTY